jgi:hypothetical protein
MMRSAEEAAILEGLLAAKATLEHAYAKTQLREYGEALAKVRMALMVMATMQRPEPSAR